MKHNPRLTNPTPVVGSKINQRKARMAASMDTTKAEPAQPGKTTWLQGMSVESFMPRSKKP